jgi:hypothetical protein
MAVAAKEGIHGLKFPDINPKRLEVFALFSTPKAYKERPQCGTHPNPNPTNTAKQVTFVATNELASLRDDDAAASTAAPRPSAAYVAPSSLSSCRPLILLRDVFFWGLVDEFDNAQVSGAHVSKISEPVPYHRRSHRALPIVVVPCPFQCSCGRAHTQVSAAWAGSRRG